MAHNAETRQQRATRKFDEQQRAHMDKVDADNMTATLRALLNLDTTKAREIIKNPRGIKSLMETERGLVCLYVMHAIVLALISEDCDTILNEMSDDNIAILRTCVSIAKKTPRGDPIAIKDTEAKRLESKKSGLTKLSDGKTREMTQHEKWENEFMLKSLEICKKVSDEAFWQDSITQLDKWADKIDTFKRKEVLLETQDTLLTIKEVADKLGTTPGKVYNHISRCLTGKNQADAAKINELFVFKDIKDGKKQVSGLRESCFEEYKKLFGKIRPYNRKPQEVKEPTNAEPKETVVAQAPVAQPQKDGLLGVTALHAFLGGLYKLLDEAKAELEAANNDYTKTFDALGKASNQVGRSMLIAQLGVANTAISNAQSKVDDLEKRINDGNAALKAKENADQAASVAKENLDKAKKELDDAKKAQQDADAIIAAILANTNTTQK